MSINLLRYAQGENISDTLSSSIGSTDTSIPVNNISKWNTSGGNVIIDRGTSSQEIVVVTGVSGSSLVVASGGRGFDSTTAVGHNSGATIESVPFAKDWNDLVTALLNILVIAGTVDTTKVVDLTTAQTLTNKTLTSPVINTPTGDVATLTGTQTLTNKRRTRRVVTTTQSATPTINTDNGDVFQITAIGQAITSMTTNLSGTPVAGDLVEIQFTDDGTARAITWGTSFASTTVTLPTTTVISTRLRVLLEWNATTSKFDCVAVA